MNEKIKITDFGVYVMVDDTHLSRWVENDRRLDHARDSLAKFRKLVPEGGTVIDCGTSIGDHTDTYANWVGPNGRVIGFEANPDVAECCALNMAKYPWVKIYNIGLSNEFGVSGIQIDANVGGSFLTPESGRSVHLAPLDSFMGEIDRCDFIKVDIEGFEALMLDGATELIKKYRPAILMEINKGALARQRFTERGVLNRLRALGYEYKPADGVMSGPQYDIIARWSKKFA